MAKKTYRTFFLKGYQLLLTGKDGRRIEIKFRGGIQVDSTSKYTTANEEIQELMEKTKDFETVFYIESVVDDGANEPVGGTAPVKKEAAPKAAEKPVMDEVKGSERFKNLVEMKNRMAELGIELDADADYNKAKAAAVAAGYDFKIKR